MQETRVPSLSQEDPLEEGMAAHSSDLAWRIPWTEEPGGLQSTGSHRVGHDLGTKQQMNILKNSFFSKPSFALRTCPPNSCCLNLHNSDLFIHPSPHLSEDAMFCLQLLSLYYCPESLGKQRAHQMCFIFLRNQNSERLFFNVWGQLFYTFCPVF